MGADAVSANPYRHACRRRGLGSDIEAVFQFPHNLAVPLSSVMEPQQRSRFHERVP